MPPIKLGAFCAFAPSDGYYPSGLFSTSTEKAHTLSATSSTTAVAPTTHMTVRKRNGQLEPLNLDKILKAITRSAKGITDVDPARVAAKTIGSLYDGATTQELDKLSIETAAALIPLGDLAGLCFDH
jgi:ATP cone domain